MHITVYLLLLKAGTKLIKRGVCGALLNDLSKATKSISLERFNIKQHKHSFDSHMQSIDNDYLGRRILSNYNIGFCENRPRLTQGNSRKVTSESQTTNMTSLSNDLLILFLTPIFLNYSV